MKNKRGISPLIATVLLVGFVIVLGVLFWIFSSGLIKDTLEKGNECNPTDVEQIDISILEANQGDEFTFTIKNEGSIKPAGYWVRLTNSALEETTTFTTSKECSPGKECDFIYKDVPGIEGVDELEIIPILVLNNKPCTALSKAKTALAV